MSRYKLRLHPEGLIPRPLDLTLKMQPLTAAAVAAETTPAPTLQVPQYIYGNYVDRAVLSVPSVLTVDTDFTVTSTNPDLVQFPIGDYYPNVGSWFMGTQWNLTPTISAVLVVTIPAGFNSVQFPIYGQWPGLGADPCALTIEAPGYATVTIPLAYRNATETLTGIDIRAFSVDAAGTYSVSVDNVLLSARALTGKRSAVVMLTWRNYLIPTSSIHTWVNSGTAPNVSVAYSADGRSCVAHAQGQNSGGTLVPYTAGQTIILTPWFSGVPGPGVAYAQTFVF